MKFTSTTATKHRPLPFSPSGHPPTEGCPVTLPSKEPEGAEHFFVVAVVVPHFLVSLPLLVVAVVVVIVFVKLKYNH